MANPKLVKELRDRTGAGFLDVKKALEATNEDIDKAIEWLQAKGAAKAAKKAGAIAAEGVVSIAQNNDVVVVFEVNSQTDFVAQNQQFVELVDKIGKGLLSGDFKNSEEANNIIIDGKTIAEITQEATATIGEKIELRRAQKVPKNGKVVGSYLHTNKQIAAIVVTDGGTEDAARNVAMHVASMNPKYLDENEVPSEIVAEMKKEISESPALASKPENIKENIMKGMLRKALSEITLTNQEFVMEKMPVSKYLSNNGAIALSMVRFAVAEGIEKVETDFASEVAAQMGAK